LNIRIAFRRVARPHRDSVAIGYSTEPIVPTRELNFSGASQKAFRDEDQ
jgi:hypothetical protein